ncbi:hypothetical protein ACFLRW_05060 [Acidobacteriota bacterium]
MIECIFTLDYEIYGNGQGSLKELVYDPAEKLKAIFQKWNSQFVLFVEAAELEMIEAQGSDVAIHMVKQQIRNFYKQGFEIGLHLHPQWYNAQYEYENKKWQVDYNDYNLCTLPRERIIKIINRSIEYLRKLLNEDDFTPFSFRAGNWLFQPTKTVSSVLAEKGIKVDSSVFKGGLQHRHKLDYRKALKNGYYWPFSDDVNVQDSLGTLIEFPIYSKMVPIWNSLSAKRIGLQRKGPMGSQISSKRLFRLLDFLRFRYPLKFDFCRMTIDEMKHMINQEIKKNQKNPDLIHPIIAIGHTKDLIDTESVEFLMEYLHNQEIPLSTFRKTYKNVCPE